MMYAFVKDGVFLGRLHDFGDDEPPVLAPSKGEWLPYTKVSPAFDPATQVLEGPSYDVTADSVTETWTVRPKTQAELDADKDNRINDIAANDLITVILHLENDSRAVKAKINQLITDTGASTAPFPANQVSQMTRVQLRTILRTLLD